MPRLTHRESEVLDLATQGLANDEIATRLAISRRTVEAHMRTVFRKTGVRRRSQLATLSEPTAAVADVSQSESSASGVRQALPPRQSAGERRLQLYDNAVQQLIARQFPLFEERVDITIIVGDDDEQDTVVERHRTAPKPYVVYRILRPIVARTDAPPPDPEDLALTCDVHGHDVHVDVQPVCDQDGRPQVIVLFQPGLQDETDWVLSYRSPRLWGPLRAAGRDTLRWAPATLDQRHKPTINELTLNVVFPAGWAGESMVEKSNLGAVSTERLPTGQVQITWHGQAPVAMTYDWTLHGRPAKSD
jgi:DNA-binding CsgD family transcriptional regulator